jgi:hypothetical protein
VTRQQPIDYPGNALGSGSDYTVFLNFLGIPIVEMSFDGRTASITRHTTTTTGCRAS